ncbi:unnamed protein product [Pieris macdunnoughi]|uniref:Uncharacterized protein n=1 Tax=Pieris macdunnoughi TaxID=345717 RepID=A0A821VPJ4_9NEOP|nr:unnamed protein product [Pieris macdunnoughi]
MSTSLINLQSNLDSTESSSLEQHNDIPITTQPRPEVSDSDAEEVEQEGEKRKKRREDLEDCCCDPYYDPDEWEFYMFCRCFGWCCVQLGKCMENMLEGCGDCITSCCDGESSEDTGGCEDVECCDCNCFD